MGMPEITFAGQEYNESDIESSNIKNAIIDAAEIRVISRKAYFELRLGYAAAAQLTGNVLVTAERLGLLLDAAGVASWNELVGRAVRARLYSKTRGGTLYKEIAAVGHIIHDLWVGLVAEGSEET